MSRPTQGHPKPTWVFAYGTITLYGLLFQVVLLTLMVPLWEPYNPDCKQPVCPTPRSLAATKGISFDFFSSGY